MKGSEKRLDRLEDKLDSVKSDLSGMKVALERYNVLLQEHMKRTAQNEKLIYGLILMAALGGAEKLGILAKVISLFG